MVPSRLTTSTGTFARTAGVDIGGRGRGRGLGGAAVAEAAHDLAVRVCELLAARIRRLHLEGPSALFTTGGVPPEGPPPSKAL